MLEGGCYCGAVRYAVTGEPFDATLCHCADCRRIAGAPAVAWFTAKAEQVRFTGRDATRFASSPAVTRTFCPVCGTGLTFASTKAPGDVDLATATLDDPGLVPPANHVWVGEALAWEVVGDGLPRYRKGRADG